MSAIERAWEQGLIAEEWPDAPPAWDACQRLAGRPHVLFLDSARPGVLGRWSFVACDPYRWLTVDQGDPFRLVEEELRRCPATTVEGLPPWQGGAAGVFGYELGGWLERLPRPSIDEFRVPELAVGMYDAVLAWDHAEGRAWKVATGRPEQGLEERRSRAAERLRQLDRWLAEGSAPVAEAGRAEPTAFHPVPGLPGVGSGFTRAGFEAAIRRAIEYVHAGDCFQVNLAQRLLHPAREGPLELYGRLRAVNPAPFAGLLDMGNAWLLSASPERFVKVEGGMAQTRPIKGTRPRGWMPEEDFLRAEDLLASEKDRAENVMIVDLLRNDLGRVCRYGSMRVESLCRLESYPTVHHLVSEVSGRLREGLGPVDVLRAAFPGGSVTGAPKVRAMEIIAELEPTVRGPYCGSLGWLGFDGGMDTSILIRTFTMAGGWLQFPAGGGIVADSDPASEYLETLHKATGLVRALR
ncbi:MAG: aminodeoxychorismate synthase component I [Gemmataceae bacterium]|nr:aminodeoxychorismate synthase component I [Gemmataceae bacterium]